MIKCAVERISSSHLMDSFAVGCGFDWPINLSDFFSDYMQVIKYDH